MKAFKIRFVTLAICALAICQCFATTFETFESTYLGNGLFQYRMTEYYDPFFLEADITSTGIGFTNAVDYWTDSTNWVADTTNAGAVDWDYVGAYPQPRPNQQTYYLQSSDTSYKLGTNAISLMSLITADFNPQNDGVVSENIVGYAEMLCLTPCSPEEADGSPADYTFTLKLIPDITINRLLFDPDHRVRGMVFDWASDSTVLLQGSPDLQNWTNITYILGTAPETTWHTNQSLSVYGSYFRLLLVASSQLTNLPPLSQSSPLSMTRSLATIQSTISTPRVTGCQRKAGALAIQIAADPGQTGTVQAINALGSVLKSQSFTAASNSVVVTFQSKGLPTPVFFRAVKEQRDTL